MFLRLKYSTVANKELAERAEQPVNSNVSKKMTNRVGKKVSNKVNKKASTE